MQYFEKLKIGDKEDKMLYALRHVVEILVLVGQGCNWIHLCMYLNKE